MALGELWAWAGLGVVLGPALAGMLLARTGNPSHVFFLKSALAFLQLLHALQCVPETLGKADRRPLSLKGVNPLSFIRLINGQYPGVLSKFALAAALISFTEGKNTNDV